MVPDQLINRRMPCSELVKTLYNVFESLVMENSVLCRKWIDGTSKETFQIVSPKFASATILKEAHQQVGHLAWSGKNI